MTTIEINALNIPKPSKLKISTMTCLCLLNTNINLDILSRFIKVYSKNDDIIRNGNGGVVYVEYFMLLPRGQYCGKKAQIKKKELQINSKIKKMLGDNDDYKDSSLGDVNYQEPDPTKSKKRKKKTIKKRQMETQATLIYHFKNNRYINIKVFNNGKIQMTGVRSKEEAEMVIINLIEIIKNTTIEKTDWNSVVDIQNNIKNEYIYTTIDGVNKVMRNIMIDSVSKWIETPDDTIEFIYSKIKESLIADNSKIKMTNFQTVMINSNYSVGFNIDRTKLHLILKRKYNIYATFESTYQAVKSYYYFNKNNTNQNGVCKCDVPCFVIKEQKKGVKPPCTQVTISVFRTGSIIITGGCTMEQINQAYDYINTVIKDNFSLIYQEKDAEPIKNIDMNMNDPICQIKMIMIERANENRRRVKKKVEPKPPKIKKEQILPIVKGKRGRKPKIISVNLNEIINSPYENKKSIEEPKIKKVKEPKIKKVKEPKIKKVKEPKIKKVK
jgi:TATA-box binding protein (TBP) (component of TFIID and TFIIIB)